jgi:glycosyltransferase involved in cell wall biosynthesis
MKILVASHTYIVDLNCEKFKALSNLEPGIEVTIVVPKKWRPGGVQNRLVETRFWQEGRFRVVPVSNLSQNNQALLTFGLDLIALLRDFQPDIIQVEQGSKALTYSEFITLNRLLGLKARNVFFTWWNLPYEVIFPVSWIESYNLRHTAGVVVGNQDGAEILRQRGYAGSIAVMPQLGIDETLFQPKPQPDLAAALGLSPDQFVVGFVGRFVPEKGLLTLCHALARLQHLNWKWLLLGRGPLREELATAATTAGIGDRLVWVESVPHDQVPHYINLMNVLVLPSETCWEFKTLTSKGWKEQFGHVLIEAMGCGVPVIGSDSGEIPHVIGGAGLVFPEGDVAALSDRLEQLMTRPNLAQDLSQKGYDRAMKHYTNHALARQLLDFYRSLSSNVHHS